MKENESYLEEYKLLRGIIVKNKDFQFIALAFTLSSIGGIMGVIAANKDMTFTDTINLLNFGMLILFISFLIIVRTVYAIKTIGGYIHTFIEPKIFNANEGFERLVDKLNASKRKTTILLAKGNHLTLSWFYFFISISVIITTLSKFKKFGIGFRMLSWVDVIILSCMTFLFLLIVFSIFELNRISKTWKHSWTYVTQSDLASVENDESANDSQ